MMDSETWATWTTFHCSWLACVRLIPRTFFPRMHALIEITVELSLLLSLPPGRPLLSSSAEVA